MLGPATRGGSTSVEQRNGPLGPNDISKLRVALREAVKTQGIKIARVAEICGVGHSTLSDFLGTRHLHSDSQPYVPGPAIRLRLLEWLKNPDMEPLLSSRQKPIGYKRTRERLLRAMENGLTAKEISRQQDVSPSVVYSLYQGRAVRVRTLIKIRIALDAWETASLTAPAEPLIDTRMAAYSAPREDRPVEPVVSPLKNQGLDGSAYCTFLIGLAERQAEKGTVDPALLDRIERFLNQ